MTPTNASNSGMINFRLKARLSRTMLPPTHLSRYQKFSQLVNYQIFLFCGTFANLYCLTPQNTHIRNNSRSIMTSPDDSWTALRIFSMQSCNLGSEVRRPVLFTACKMGKILFWLFSIIQFTLCNATVKCICCANIKHYVYKCKQNKTMNKQSNINKKKIYLLAN